MALNEVCWWLGLALSITSWHLPRISAIQAASYCICQAIIPVITFFCNYLQQKGKICVYNIFVFLLICIFMCIKFFREFLSDFDAFFHFHGFNLAGSHAGAVSWQMMIWWIMTDDEYNVLFSPVRLPSRLGTPNVCPSILLVIKWKLHEVLSCHHSRIFRTGRRQCSGGAERGG